MAVKASVFAGMLGLASIANAGFAPASWKIREAMNSTSYVTRLCTTMKVPPVPSQKGVLLWPGMYTEEDWLVQSIIGNEDDYIQNFCPGNKPSDNIWCAFTYAYKGGMKTNPAAKGAIVKEGDLLVMDYTYDEKTKNTTQTITLSSTGKEISRLSAATGPGYRLEDSIECHGHYNGATPAHTYLNTTISLVQPNPSFGKSLQTTGSTPKNVSSADGGKTWFIPKIDIDTSTCTSSG